MKRRFGEGTGQETQGFTEKRKEEREKTIQQGASVVPMATAGLRKSRAGSRWRGDASSLRPSGRQRADTTLPSGPPPAHPPALPGAERGGWPLVTTSLADQRKETEAGYVEVFSRV